MRRFVLASVLLLPVGMLSAQTSKLLDGIQLLDPGLTARIVSSTALGDCAWPAGDPRNLACQPFNAFTLPNWPLADGSLLMQGDSVTSPTNCGSLTLYNSRIYRLMPDNSVTEPFRVYQQACLVCEGSVCTQRQDVSISFLPDVQTGILHGWEVYNIRDSTFQVVLYSESGHITISGFPRLFDTLLTFVPGGTLAALIPAMPDGFRSADSMQVWTGDVRSMPDWSQAQPLTCSAATSPTPGQVVTVPDTLPDPPIGHGRYYLTASVNGPDRRLGRQYVNGAFSARNPTTLPACQE